MASSTQTAPEGAIEPFLIPLEGQAEVVREILEPMLRGQGLELVQLHLVRGAHRDQLRLFLDKLDASGTIAISDLEGANRLISDLLDVEDNARGLFKKPYDLEVGSPGLDRPLTKKSHFGAAAGKRVRVKTRNPVSVNGVGARSLLGVVDSAGDDTFVLRVDGSEAPVQVRFDDVTSAHIQFELPPPGDGRPQRQKKQKDKARS